ncbi:Uncharacterised protein [uncultured archaeon]|nr:Uncharacterised protein [uncultured archaeon]
MQDKIVRGAHDRVLMMPLEVADTACPHKKKEQTETQLTPELVVRRNELGQLVLDADKRQGLKEEFERGLELDDVLYPVTDPQMVAHVRKNAGVVTRVVEW